ncbi:MAG: thioesterase [Blautia sp.]|nr:thioesterase [Blautia sp.]
MYEFDSRVRYSEVDAGGELTWQALMDYFQDCSVFHSEQHNIGIDYLKEQHMAWMLSSWQICRNRMPRLAELVTVQTWAYDMKGFYGYRNFSINDSGGKRLAYANSVWILVDTKSGRPMRIPMEMPEKYGMEERLPMDVCGRKLAVPGEYGEKEPFVVPSYFIDTNQHMNNSRYVQVALQYVPKDFSVGEVRVEYRRAAKQADVMLPRVTVTEEKVVVALCAEDKTPYAVTEFWREISGKTL